MTDPGIDNPADTGIDEAHSGHRFVVVCTANQCRSVMAEHLFRRELARHSINAEIGPEIHPEIQPDVRSGGLLPGGTPATDWTSRTMRELGFDITGHRSRQVGSWIGSATLILTMTAEQTRAVVNRQRSLWSMTFPLRDLLARGARLGPRPPDRDLATWIAAVHDGRTWQDTLDRTCDIADPTGESMARHRRLATELGADLAQLCGLLYGRADPSPEATGSLHPA